MKVTELKIRHWPHSGAAFQDPFPPPPSIWRFWTFFHPRVCVCGFPLKMKNQLSDEAQRLCFWCTPLCFLNYILFSLFFFRCVVWGDRRSTPSTVSLAASLIVRSTGSSIAIIIGWRLSFGTCSISDRRNIREVWRPQMADGELWPVRRPGQLNHLLVQTPHLTVT